ncbi:hypothetical protein B0H34DRAFT_616330, partial [Crassisporium funariophilum]
LGPDTHHTVYEAEIVGLTLSLHLLTSLGRQLSDAVTLGSNSQAAIRALNNQLPHPAHYLLDIVVDLRITWTPGHSDFDPNERADTVAKTAAQGTSSPPNLLPVYLR